MRNTRNKRKLILSGIALGVIAIISYAAYYLTLKRPIASDLKTSYVYIDRDDNIDSLYTKLEQIIEKPLPKSFMLLADKKGLAQHINTGKYEITNRDTSYSLFTKLSRGHQKPSRLVFNNIRTKEQLAGRLSSQLMIDSLEIITALEDTQLIEQLGFTPETIVEMFIPNTYEVYWNMLPNELLSRFKKEYNKFWNTERQDRAKEIGLTPSQIAIIASIVEEETIVADEKPIVAGLYINRLKRGIPLQADPTIKFALQNFEIRRVLDRDKSVDSPYNTYKYAGLPPGPIRLPSISGLQSVLNYTESNYLYMCAKEDLSGRHNFTTNYTEHLANSRRYHQALNNRRIYR